MATSIATRALPPRVAVALAAVLNFAGAFLSLKVAATVAEGIVKPGAITPAIILAGLLGGIFWYLITWARGIPSSSSHAPIGGVIGADVPSWVVVTCATAIALGTYIGGWRIIRTLGHGVTKLETPQGFAAETSSAVVILAASQAGYPLSTTHVTSGGVMGAGVGKRAAPVNWTTAQRMLFAWLVTIPAAAVIAGAFYLVVDEIGKDIAGPLAISSVAAIAAALLFFHARSNPVTAQDV
jgi:phosphate/sulfate permease